MVETLFIAASPTRCESFEKAFSYIDDWAFNSANNLITALNHLLTKTVDIILLDLEAPIRGLKQLLKVIKLKFPQKYRIVIRSPRYQLTHRHYLEEAHSSFQKPENLSEMRNIVRKINTFCPIEKEDVSFEKTDGEDPIDAFYTAFYRDLCESECTYSYVLEKVVSNRDLSKMILNRINSPYYGLYTPIKSVGRAIKLMGTDGVKALLEDHFGPALFDELTPLGQVS